MEYAQGSRLRCGTCLLLLLNTFYFILEYIWSTIITIDSGTQQSNSAMHICVSILPPAPSHPGCHTIECALCFRLLPSSLRSRPQWNHFLSRCGRVNSSLTVLSQDKASTANTDQGRLTQSVLSWESKSGARISGDNCQSVRLLSQSRCSDLNPCPFTWDTRLMPWNPPSLSFQEILLPLSCSSYAFRKPAWKINFLKSCVSEKSIYSFYLIDNLNDPNPKPFSYM